MNKTSQPFPRPDQPEGGLLRLMDTPLRYGIVTRVLHWALAALILWQLLGMVLKLALGRQPVAAFFVGSHHAVGTTIFILVVLRVIWAFVNRKNRPQHGEGFIGIAARLGHAMLYLVMFTVPAVAVLRAYGGTRAFAPFGFEIFPAREEPIAWMVDLADLLHGELGWAMAALIFGHVLMVVLHERLWRDGTLARMAGRAKSS